MEILRNLLREELLLLLLWNELLLRVGLKRLRAGLKRLRAPGKRGVWEIESTSR